jgi:uncharacterized membrane protein YedE/YeeE
MTILIIFFGFIFAAILQYARLNKFDVITGLALRENLAVAKAIALAIGIGAIILNVEIALGFAAYHVKPFVFGGLLLGGVIFGSGMAILGYCPGTLAISAGEGSLDAIIGMIGGLVGGVVYTLLLPVVSPLLGPKCGTFSLYSLTGGNILFYILLLFIGVSFVALSFWLHKIDKNKEKQWVYSGIALAVLNAIVFLSATTGRPIGASTTFPYVGDLLTGFTANNYFSKIRTPGNWELYFLSGAFLAGVVISLIKKDFKITLIHNNWKKQKNNSNGNRSFWAFVGGFILIFGARMAGGCTSGHILSGGMQLAFSSLFFAVFVFVGLLVTGKLFYK